MSENVKHDRITNFVTGPCALHARDVLSKIAPRIDGIASSVTDLQPDRRSATAPAEYRPKSPHHGKQLSTRVHSAVPDLEPHPMAAVDLASPVLEATEEARMWLSLFGIVMLMSVGFGAGSLLASLFERNAL